MRARVRTVIGWSLVWLGCSPSPEQTFDAADVATDVQGEAPDVGTAADQGAADARPEGPADATEADRPAADVARDASDAHDGPRAEPDVPAVDRPDAADASPDVFDAPRDAPTDAPPDAPLDAPRDAGELDRPSSADVPGEASLDADRPDAVPFDAPFDVALDAPRDAPTAADAAADASTDVAPPDAPRDVALADVCTSWGETIVADGRTDSRGRPCGQFDQRICDTGPACDSGLGERPTWGICRRIGEYDGPCAAGERCAAGLRCHFGYCVCEARSAVCGTAAGWRCEELISTFPYTYRCCRPLDMPCCADTDCCGAFTSRAACRGGRCVATTPTCLGVLQSCSAGQCCAPFVCTGSPPRCNDGL